jgi:hypothetical protein
MSYDTQRLMVAYFTGGSELIARNDDYSKIPQHMVIAPWFQGEEELALQALEQVATQYAAPIRAATGSIKPVGIGVIARNIFPERELKQLNTRVIEALGKFALRLEDPHYDFRPVIIIDNDQAKIPPSIDLEIDHLALVEDHQTGTYSIPGCVPIGYN